MAPTPIILPAALPTELLTYVLIHQSYPTTLIICTSRKIFLDSIISTLNYSSTHPPTEEQPQLEHTTEDETPPPTDDTIDRAPQEASKPDPNHSTLDQHPLLINTIHQLITSRSINTVFVPTISHLRAYLATFPKFVASETLSPAQDWDKPGERCPLLVVYGMLELHRDTSEWSAQGLASTLASLVQVGLLSERRVVIFERKVEEDSRSDKVGEEGEMEIVEEERESPWKELVPLLSGSARRAGLDIDSQGWSGRTVEIGRILRRWFVFEKGDWSLKKSGK
ncbi:hypothetical protein B7463_g8074, partial [Scytalidium lignicola]